MLPRFSHVGHTRCSLHIVNLVARLMIRQFDIPTNHAGQNVDIQSQEITPDELVDVTDEGLHGPAAEIDLRTRIMLEGIRPMMCSMGQKKKIMLKGGLTR